MPRRRAKLVAVCSCGDSGCGHIDCLVSEEPDIVSFRQFGGDTAIDRVSKFEFIFSRENYETVVRDMIALARDYYLKYPPVSATNTCRAIALLKKTNGAVL